MAGTGGWLSSRAGSSASAVHAKRLAQNTPLAGRPAILASLPDAVIPDASHQRSSSSQTPASSRAVASASPIIPSLIDLGRRSSLSTREGIASPPVSVRRISLSTREGLASPPVSVRISELSDMHTTRLASLHNVYTNVPSLTSAATWAAEASKATCVGADTSSEVEALCNDLAKQLANLEAELEAKHKEVNGTAEQSRNIKNQIAAIDDKMASARQARIDAVDKVLGLTRISAIELRAMKNRPPPIARRAIEAIYTLLNCRRWQPSSSPGLKGFDVEKEWSRIQRMLSDDGFVQSVLQFEVAGLDLAPNVAEYVTEKYFPRLLQEMQVLSASGDCQTSSSKSQQQTDAASSAEPSSLPHVGKVSARRGSAGGAAKTTAEKEHPTSIKPTSAREGLLPAAPGAIPATARADAKVPPSGATPHHRGGGREQKTPRSSVSERSRVEARSGNENLDINSVEYASRACGAMVHWALEVLREFFTLRGFRMQREALELQLEELGTRRRDEAIAQLQEEIQRLSEEFERWRKRLTELRNRESEAERARANLLKLSRLEERSTRTSELESGLVRTGRGAKLEPMVAPSAPCSEALPTTTLGRGGPVLRTIQQPTKSKSRSRAAREKPSENDAWPPRGRKYLHVMSSSALAIKTVVDEAADRGDDWPLSPSIVANTNNLRQSSG